MDICRYLHFVETSAVTGEGISFGFRELILTIRKNQSLSSSPSHQKKGFVKVRRMGSKEGSKKRFLWAMESGVRIYKDQPVNIFHAHIDISHLPLQTSFTDTSSLRGVIAFTNCTIETETAQIGPTRCVN